MSQHSLRCDIGHKLVKYFSRLHHARPPVKILAMHQCLLALFWQTCIAGGAKKYVHSKLLLALIMYYHSDSNIRGTWYLWEGLGNFAKELCQFIVIFAIWGSTIGN